MTLRTLILAFLDALADAADMTDDGPSIKGLFKNVVRYVCLIPTAPRILPIVVPTEFG